MLNSRFSRVLVAVIVAFSITLQATQTLAGTTGTLSGTVVDASTKQPLAGAKISAASPSQFASATTDGSGHFTLLNLSPDTYTLSIEYKGYDASVVSGVVVVADNTHEVSIAAQKTLQTIAHITTRAASALIRPGTTADVYSIDPVAQGKVAAAGGGGNLNSAYSALATVPGVMVLPGLNGYVGAGAGTLSIRGGEYDQIGFEVDGVPLNRSFDNYPSGPTSSLGQQELQVYTGAPPASSASDGISGYINQVIRTGTLPGSQSVTIGLGGPAFYHKIAAEIGGESENRRFSYYAGVGGYDQQFRNVDQFNGADLSQLYGAILGNCLQQTATGPVEVSRKVAPSCYSGSGTGAFNNGYVLGPINLNSVSLIVGGVSQVIDRDNVINLHYYFPHKDGSRDDLQALYENNYIDNLVYGSTNDQGGAGFLTAIGVGVPSYVDGYQLNLPTGGFLPANYKSFASHYAFPNAPTHPFDGAIDPNAEDSISINNQVISKLQYTKSLGSTAYARIMGYTYYSNFDSDGPQCAYAQIYGAGDCGVSGDYELSSHTRGLTFTAVDQVNAKNLLQLDAGYTTASTVRDNNTEFFNGPFSQFGIVDNRTAVGVLVNSKNPTNGVCYSATAQPVPCYSSNADLNAGSAAGNAQYATLQQAYAGSVPGVPSGNCGTGACQYLVVGNGQYATYNTVKPNFYGLSLTDEFRPSEKLAINAGLRLDDYQFVGGDTSGGPARAFWYNAYNSEMCVSKTNQLVYSKVFDLGLASPSSACPSGYSAAHFTNPSGDVAQTYPVFEPRLGATYTVNPTTVLRASYGRFAQPANAAYEQYDALQSNTPALLYGTYGFQQYGYTSPNHPIPPATSNNYDFSIEHEFPGQLAVKLTPFLRATQNQTESFFLDKATNFVSGLNVGSQQSRGFEFEMDKGNFAQRGLAAKLSFAYTNSIVKYDTLSNGTTVVSPVADAINAYNAFTKAGGGAPCYTPYVAATGTTPASGGVADPACAAGSIANPYYNAALQSTRAYTAGATSIPYPTIPAGVGVQAVSSGVPYVASLVLNEKINKFSITPVIQYFGGQRYGNPLSTAGVNPAMCGAALTAAVTTAGDPRYTNGVQSGSPFDATTCGQLQAIPNTQTGAFDGIGSYVEPSQLLVHFQFTYEATKNFSLVANLANAVNTCFGGSSVPWAVKGACGYTYANDGFAGAIGNTYNPGNGIQPLGQHAYAPSFSQLPVGIFVSGNFKM